MKNRNVNLKLQKREAKLRLQRERRRTVLYACLVGILLIATVAVLTIRPDYVYLEKETVIGENGEEKERYVDADHGIAYLAAPPFAYEPVTYVAKPYAKLGTSYLYPMDGVGGDQWLALEVVDGIFDVYYNEMLTLPTLTSFEASDLVVCVDNSGRPSGLPLTFDKDELADILDEILDGRTEETLMGGVAAVYTLRFVSEEYPFLYYCVKYIVTDEGSYYYDYVGNTYTKAGGLVDDHLREYYQSTNGETAS